jgi:hypothetical protein
MQMAGRQQDVGNIQSLLGLQPVAAQAGLMAGMQQGASPFQMGQMQRGMGLDPGAAGLGANFAANVFGTEGQMFSKKKSPFETVIGGLSGMGTGYGALRKALT